MRLLGTLTAGWRGDLLALFAGALLPLAFAPFHLFPLAVIAPALLYLTWLDTSDVQGCTNVAGGRTPGATPKRGFRRGWLFGLGMFGVGVSWVYVAIHVFGEASILLAGFLTGLFVALLSLFPALLGYTVTRFYAQRTLAVKLLLIFPAAWVLFEWLRGWVLSGFPWLNLGYSQISAPLAGLAPILGVYGVSWAVALSAGLLLYAITAPKPRLGRALVVLVLLWGGSALLTPIAWTQPHGKPLRVSLIQGNIPQEIKWQPEQRRRTLDLYAQLTAQRWGDDLIVWPEAAITMFYHEVADNYLAQLAATARRHNTDLILGLSVEDPDTGRYYNSMMSLGRSEGFYFKQHLVPFGDYVPYADWLRGLIKFFDLPMSGYSPGPPHQPLLQAAGHKIAGTICYEDAFGEEVIRQLPEASVLVNLTNNAWYGDSFAPPQHLQMSRMRALETGRPLLRATTNGISAIVDHKGKVTAASPQFKTYVLSGTMQPMQGVTPYVYWGNIPVLLGLVLIAVSVPFYNRSASAVVN
ncbi:MAG: apolipoprotein N-acyltransferase [Gammaproteobacteria bacterium]|nr:apolipoprotein N-acyltransferase [Gammaproteobacteria bacterium]